MTPGEQSASVANVIFSGRCHCQYIMSFTALEQPSYSIFLPFDARHECFEMANSTKTPRVRENPQSLLSLSRVDEQQLGELAAARGRAVLTTPCKIHEAPLMLSRPSQVIASPRLVSAADVRSPADES